MKNIIALLAVLLFTVQPNYADAWGSPPGGTLAVTAGTAIRIATIQTKASSIFIQANPGPSAGVIYVLWAPPQLTCARGNGTTVQIATLQAATATAPGGNITIPSNPDPAGGVDVDQYCVDGAHSTDPVQVSWKLRQ